MAPKMRKNIWGQPTVREKQTTQYFQDLVKKGNWRKKIKSIPGRKTNLHPSISVNHHQEELFEELPLLPQPEDLLSLPQPLPPLIELSLPFEAPQPPALAPPVLR